MVKDLHGMVCFCLCFVLEICPEFLQNDNNTLNYDYGPSTKTLQRIVNQPSFRLPFGYKDTFEMLFP